MEIIRLPKNLGSLASLKTLNARLHERACQLDWSEVKEAEPKKLAALLEGLSLDVHGEELGLGSVPEALQPALLAGFGKPRGPKRPRRTARPSAPVAKAPGVFESGEEELPVEEEAPLAPVEEPREPRLPPPLLQAPSPVEVRAELEEAVVLDLLGPRGGEREELERGNPRDHYILGVLFPLRSRMKAEAEEDLAAAGDGGEESGPAEVSDAQESTLPSSFGMSFCVAREVKRLRVTVRWGRYLRKPSDRLKKDDGGPATVWKREPMGGTRLLPLDEGPLGPYTLMDEVPEVVVKGVSRVAGGQRIVSLFLVNGQAEPEKLRDEASLFQPELIVEGEEDAPVFLKRALVRDGEGADPVAHEEAEAMDMLYRHHVEFAVGHGVAVHADPDPGDFRRAVRVRTRVMPTYEVPQQQAPGPEEVPELSGLVLDMKELAETDGSLLVERLRALPDAYAAWILRQRERLRKGEDGLESFGTPGSKALDRCESALRRLREGLEVLRTDEKAQAAFRFANRAMWLQRTRSAYAEKVRREKDPARRKALKPETYDEPRERSWRPFQLAFVLLNVPALARLDHPDRREDAEATADLLWFPTGGGKTEAYLGVAAFAMSIRRLHGTVEGRSSEGVAVLMRYTLRVLTLQQFQRAAALLCACELIRREDEATWGKEPLRLGLWVGANTTPNRTEDAAEALKRVHGHAPQGRARGTPAQLTNCPWCGATIEPGKNITVEAYNRGGGRTLMYCGDPLGSCVFTARKSPGEGLPVLVVDEEIYRRLPAMLIATVDKFAQMPWNGRTQMLFGQVTHRCPRHGWRSPEVDDADSHPATDRLPAVKSVATGPLRPPDLIIQDELHLISGPLGTLTGLYETAVDRLATWAVGGVRVRPKVIASTATVRRAAEQVKSLFLRGVQVFPPHGLEVRDNFFSVQRSTGKVPGRRYLGVCAPGRRLKGTLIRVYVALLAAAQQLYERYGTAVDPWMTLVGYFMSLRELAGMRRMVDDDVRARLRDTDRRGLARRGPPSLEELTSRLSASDIPRLLDRLELPFPRPDQERKPEARPLDVLLATNMISVGVDVKRLGLMVTGGQPKSTAEYIQATSRVGRSAPGLVCTVFNWARPRDLSHYEAFEHYHATFYKHVEALSVTPFSARALDRGLSALLVSLVRLSGPDFNPNARAQAFQRELSVVNEAVATIIRRAAEVTESQEIAEEVRTMLGLRLDTWGREARATQAGVRLGYRGERDGSTHGLLQEPTVGEWAEFTCLHSLRDVESMVPLRLHDTDANDGKEVW